MSHIYQPTTGDKGIEQIISYYEEMASRGLCRSRTDFLRNWLGRSHNYFAPSLKRKTIGMDVYVRLISKLQAANHHDLAARIMGDMFR